MTSASTLIRRAGKAKTKAEATRLRAQAAKLRREARNEKRWERVPATGVGEDPKVRMPPPNKPRPMTGLPNKNKILKGLEQALNQARGDKQAMHFEHRAEQGWTPVQPEPLVSLDRAEALMKLARSKNTEAVVLQSELCRMAANAQYEAKQEAQEAHRKALIHNNEQHHINVVCAFVAAAEGLALSNGGPMPATAVIAGYTLARVVDALQKAGYSADGLKSMSRGALEARLNR